MRLDGRSKIEGATVEKVEQGWVSSRLSYRAPLVPQVGDLVAEWKAPGPKYHRMQRFVIRIQRSGAGGQATVTLSLPPSLRGAFEQEISFGVSIDLGGRRVSQGVLVLISQGPIHFGHVRLLQSSEERDYDKYTRVMRGDRKGFTATFADMTYRPLVPAAHSILFRVFEVDTAAMQGALIMEAALPVELDSIKSRWPCRVFGPTVVAPPLTPNLFRIEPPQGGVLPPHTMVSVFVTKGTLFPT